MNIDTPISLAHRSDDELLRQFKATASQELLGQLYARYIPLVYGLCLKYLQQIEDAEDAVSDIYEELSRKIQRYQIDNFKTWLYSTAKNHCLQILRKEKDRIFEEIDGNFMESDDFEYLIDVDEDKEKEDALNYCLDTLSEEQRQCIVQFFFDNLSYADIVKKNGFALNKVKSYIQNGKRNLKICILNIINS
jgi:RNA polymerase sigma-70 factor (ECF subfamily)